MSKSHQWEVLSLTTKSREPNSRCFFFQYPPSFLFAWVRHFISSCFLGVGAFGTFFPTFLLSPLKAFCPMLVDELPILSNVFPVVAWSCSCVRITSQAVGSQPAGLDRIAWVGSNIGFFSVLELTPGSDALHAMIYSPVCVHCLIDLDPFAEIRRSEVSVSLLRPLFFLENPQSQLWCNVLPPTGTLFVAYCWSCSFDSSCSALILWALVAHFCFWPRVCLHKVSRLVFIYNLTNYFYSLLMYFLQLFPTPWEA